MRSIALLGPYATTPRTWGDRQLLPLTWLVSAMPFLLQYHGLWTRGGDGDFYLALARNLSHGEGYRYNDQGVALVPPGWPMMLAAAIWISPLIAWLKLWTLASIVLFAGFAYGSLRRLAEPWPVFFAVAGTAWLHPFTELSATFFSDPPFLAFAWAAVWMALRGREGRRVWWIGAGLALLIACTIRWVGVLWMPAVALACLRGSWSRRFIYIALSGAAAVMLVGLATLFILRALVNADSDAESFTSSGYVIFGGSGKDAILLVRIFLVPQWLSELLWSQAGRTGVSRWPAFAMAGIALIPIGFVLTREVRKGRWLWLALPIFALPLVMRWPHSIARYWLPIAPLILLALALAVTDRRWFVRWIAIVTLAGALAYNVAALGFETWAARDPLANHEAGYQASMNQIAEWLRVNDPPEGIAVSQRWEINGRVNTSLGPRRDVVFLIDRTALDVPPRLGGEPHSHLGEWALENGARWYIVPPTMKRVMHWRTEESPTPTTTWRLFNLDRGRWHPVKVGMPPAGVYAVPEREEF